MITPPYASPAPGGGGGDYERTTPGIRKNPKHFSGTGNSVLIATGGCPCGGGKAPRSIKSKFPPEFFTRKTSRRGDPLSPLSKKMEVTTMESEIIGLVLGTVLPLYPVLFMIHQRIGRYDEVVEEFRRLQDEHEKCREAHYGG